MTSTLLFLTALAAMPASARKAEKPAPPAVAAVEKEAEEFLSVYAGLYQGVYAVTSRAAWDATTDVTPEHDGARVASSKALAAFTGAPLVIERARGYLAHRAELTELTARQLQKVWLAAAENPGTLPGVVAKRVEAESRQSSTLDSFQFCLERSSGSDRTCLKPTTANGIDDTLQSSRDLGERLRVWEASKESGPALKPGLADLQGLRNSVSRHFGYKSFYDLQAADYDMSAREMDKLLEGFLRDIDPLYKQLHCWTKYELAKRYGQPIPKLIPAHWIDNRWAQEWAGVVTGVDLDPLFKDRAPQWIVKQAEEFYFSMGFAKLPESFWKASDLYPVASGDKRKKNTHASAWHVDLDKDVRSLMSVEPNAQWFSTAHHELGHIYYYLSYSRPEVPLLLREGANRGFHEGIGELIAMASLQAPYLRQKGILPAGKNIDQTKWLLDEALSRTVAFLPFSAGVMSSWERDLYERDLPPSEWNARWWEYAAKYQGVAPPSARGEGFCDACTKTHVNDDPAQYYDYAIATVLKYQLHQHICKEILKQDPRSCNYYGSKEVGDFLKGLLSQGALRDWRELLKEKTGQELSTKPMMEYFAPLMAYLENENKGRACGW